ncbi:MAG: DUF1501 domain-containing protein [Nocardioidaceae bacterium]
MTTKTECGCEDYARSTASRRTFLKGLGTVAAGATMATMHGTVFRQVAFASTPTADNILIVLSLRGGVDGMSLVVPYGDPFYASSRPKIAIPPSSLLATDGMFGLHPQFNPLLPMWKSGQMAAVQAVGLPQPNRSHFSAIEVVEEADPGSTARVGWLNRMVSLTAPDSLIGAVQIGTSVPSTQIYGPQPTIETTDVSKVALVGPPNAMPQRRASLNAMWQGVDDELGNGARDAMQVDGVWAPVLTQSPNPQNGANYPISDIGDALAQTARLLRADVGAEVVTVDYGSWDMHTDLGTLAWGDMQDMVSIMSQSVSAFFTDIGSTLAAKVTVVTISEFGRCVMENGNVGLDHGYGNTMLLFGAGVRGGQVYGTWPGLAPANQVGGDLQVTTDYRSVLWEVVNTRFPAATLSQVFPNFSPETVGVMRGA